MRTCRSSEAGIRASEIRPVVKTTSTWKLISHEPITYSPECSALGVCALIGLWVLVVLRAVTVAGDNKNTENVSHDDCSRGRVSVRDTELGRGELDC